MTYNIKKWEEFLEYKENIARQYSPTINWKEFYLKDCELIYIDSQSKKNKLIKKYPAYWSVLDVNGKWWEWESSYNFIRVGQIVSISKTGDLRYIFSSMDTNYTNFTHENKKIIYKNLTQIQKSML